MHSLVYLFTHSLVYLSAPRLLASLLICSFIGPACLPGQEAFLPDDPLPPSRILDILSLVFQYIVA